VLSALEQEIRITAVCDILPERAEALAAKLGARAVDGYHKLLDDVDVVWDCTPPTSRPEVVIGCARAGKHLFSEKPIALDLETADRIVEAVRETGVTFMTDYVLRFTNPYRAAHDLFATGELGRLVNVYTRRYMPTDMRPVWFGDQRRSGGVAIDFASHDFDLLRWFGGMPKRVFGQVDRVREGVQADEHVQAMLVFEQGMGSTDESWWAPASVSTFGVVGSRGSVAVDGSGRVRLRMDGEAEVDLDVNADTRIDLSGNVGGDAQRSRARQESVQEHLLRCVREHETPLVTAWEARETLRLVLAVQQSARTGAAVEP
jgi:predicted dehydrogenase